jgi:hypothetical protein
MQQRPPAKASPPPRAIRDADVYFAVIEPHFERVSIYDGPEVFLREYAKTPERARHLLAAHWCVSEVSNGGFLQFFSGAAGVLAPEAVEAFEAIGLSRNAQLIRQAMRTFGANYPRDAAKRSEAIERQQKRAGKARPWAAQDAAFFAALKQRPGGFDAAAVAYARAAS